MTDAAAAPPAQPAPAQRLSDEQKQRIHDETGASHALICLVELAIKDTMQPPATTGPICWNCDTALPKGCSGVNRDDGEACALNAPKDKP